MDTLPTTRLLRRRGLRADLFLAACAKCFYCDSPLGADWHVDHFFPWGHGGSTKPSNLRASCKRCNLKKGNTILTTGLSAFDYEDMRFFKTDFPNSKGMHTCQEGAYNCIIRQLDQLNEKSCTIFLPTGAGKSDLIRAATIGLVSIRKKFRGVWCFSPSTELKKQVKSDGIENMLDRLQWQPENGINPFMTEDRLDNERFRSGCLMESFTIQYLTTNGNVERFIKHALHMKSQTGLLPLVIFDESHLLSEGNVWGSAAIEMQKVGIPIVLVTGTPFRANNLRIPGFRCELNEEYTKNFVRTSKTDDPMVIRIQKGVEECCRFTLHADYGYTYQRAWDEKIILKPDPIFIDATCLADNEVLSEMPKSRSSRMTRNYLMDERTIEQAVKKGIDSIRARKRADPSCACIVATISDESATISAEDGLDFSDIHAKKIEREFKRQAPDLTVITATSNTEAGLKEQQTSLEKFKTKNIDVLIVKVMGTLGFNCPRIKTVIHLSDYRTLPCFVQLVNRGCRNHANQRSYDLIMPKDILMQDLWNKFMACTGLIINETQKEEITYDQEHIIDGDQDKDPKVMTTWDHHNFSTDPNSKRNQNDEIIEMLNAKIPFLYNKLNHQEKLDYYQAMAMTQGEDWLVKFPSPEQPAMRTKPLLDVNDEETRLRSEANSLVKEIVMNIVEIRGGYTKELYGAIVKRLWTCIKRKCGFRPNQSLQNLVGIESYQSFIKCAMKIKEDIVCKNDDDEFDYSRYFS